MGLVFFENRCKGCQVCVATCNRGALGAGGRLNTKGFRLPELREPANCNGCGLCAVMCPDVAIGFVD